MVNGKQIFATLAAAAAAAALSFSGCTEKKHDPYAKQYQRKAVEKVEKPAVKATEDFFPLKINFSWKYYLWDCPSCPRKSIDVILTGTKEIDGRKVYLINDGNTGYIEKDDAVYLVLINNGSLVNLGVAGKHDLKPGDKWEITLGSKSKATKLSPNASKGNSGKWKLSIAEQAKPLTSVCGIRRMLGLPSGETTKTYFNAICCEATEKSGDTVKHEHIACYASGVGLIAEYFTDAKSEIAGFSANPSTVDNTAAPKK